MIFNILLNPAHDRTSIAALNDVYFTDGITELIFFNDKKPGLKLVKVDIEGKHLTGAIFEVKTKAGVKIGDFPVGADGTITVPQKHLAEGYYLVTEKQAPAGYILDKTPHEVYLRPGKPTLTVQVLGTVPNGYQIVNRADVGGRYLYAWQTAQASWLTLVRKLIPTITLPKTGY